MVKDPACFAVNRGTAHIQMEGYDAPQYANVQYPWDGRKEIMPGEVPERSDPVAGYVTYVGGDDSRGAWPKPETLLDVREKMEFTFYFKGI